MAFLAIVLLLRGGLSALQSATMLSALPFTFIMLFICWGLVKALRLDATKMQALQTARITPRAIQNPRSWQQRLGLIMHYPHTQQEVETYIQDVVKKAFLSVQKELKRRKLDIIAYSCINLPPIPIRSLPLIPVSSRPLRVYSVIEFKGFIAQTYS